MYSKLLRYLIYTIIAITIFFIIAPILSIFLNLTSNGLLSAIQDNEVWASIYISILSAALATITGCILGIPFGYFLSKKSFKGKSILESIINIPVAIPHVAVGIALLSLFNERTFIGSFFGNFNITFVDTIYGIIISMLFVSMSFIISSAIVGFEGVGKEIEMVARSHGASFYYTFIHITFPLAFPSILRGAVLAFARSVSEVGAILIIAYYPKTAPILMYERFEGYGLNAARPVCAMVILVCLIIFFGLLYLSKRYARS